MSADLHVRPARSGDVELILAMIRELAEYERLADTVTATEDELARALFGARPAGEVLITEWQSQTAGFVLYFNRYWSFQARAGLLGMSVRARGLSRPWHRPSAAGAGLVSNAVEMGAGRLDWVVLDWNEQAIGLYEDLGSPRAQRLTALSIGWTLTEAAVRGPVRMTTRRSPGEAR